MSFIYSLFQAFLFITITIVSTFIVYVVFYDVYQCNIKPYLVYKKEMTENKKKLKQTLMDQYLKGYKSD